LFTPLLLLGCETSEQNVSPQAYRAFDAFSSSEISRAVAAARTQSTVAPGARVVSVTLEEPDKLIVLAGRVVDRVAVVTTYDMARDVAVETRVRVPDRRVQSTRTVPGVQPPLGAQDAQRASEIVNADTRWVEALRRRGVTDIDDVSAGGSAGYFGDSAQSGRLVRVIPSLREAARDPSYLRPIEGVSALVNLTSGRVESLTDEAIVPVSNTTRFSKLSDDEPSPRNEVVSIARGRIQARANRLLRSEPARPDSPCAVDDQRLFDRRRCTVEPASVTELASCTPERKTVMSRCFL
jgi:Cu2+-containing amine oxidase